MKSKPFYKSLTFWGCASLFVSGGLAAIGQADALAAITGVIGLPLAGYGLRRALD